MRRTLLAALALGLAVAVGAAPLVPREVDAQEKVKIRVAALTLPVFNPIIVNLLREKGIDARHGFEMEVKSYPSIATFYAALATGEVDTTLVGGPNVFQKMRNEGVPIKIVATAVPLSDLVIVAADPSIRTFTDLKGKTLAADMGSGQYQVASIYGRSKGVALGTDVTVVQASFALARTQLAARRVDAAMVIEPIVTMMLKENPAYRMIFNGATAWRELTGADGWELLVPLREDFIARHPGAVTRWIAALQDVQAFIGQHLDEADAIVARRVKLPPGVFKEAVASKRWVFDVQPAWGKERRIIWDMFERAVAARYLDRLPDEGIIYTP
ncbi:MAG TPA: ABC transporter substrate-binding protein [Candidatus Tectomicrobia bacterium]|nr:ABC transporter substrate-binding protein [Candidatus Tectomicrobia bacterium]